MSGNQPPRSGTDWLKQQRARATQGVTAQPPCDLVSAEDAKTEAWLHERNVKFAPKTMIPMGMVDEKRSLANQARPTPLVPESVERFAIALREARYLGAIVVYTSGNRVIIIDGNNRFAAHKKDGQQFIAGYVISDDTPSEIIDLLTVEANTRHGVTPDPKWRVTQAIHLLARGFTIEEAARAAKVTPGQVSNERAVNRADERARALKVHGFSDLATTVRRRIGSLTSDPVFFQAARTAIDTVLRVDELDPYIRAIKGGRSDEEQIQVIAAIAAERKLEEQRRKVHGTRRTVSSEKINLVSSLGKLRNIDTAKLIRQTMTQSERDEMIRQIDTAGEKLIEIQIALGNTKPEEE